MTYVVALPRDFPILGAFEPPGPDQRQTVERKVPMKLRLALFAAALCVLAGLLAFGPIWP